VKTTAHIFPEKILLPITLLMLIYSGCIKLPTTKYDQLNTVTKNLGQKVSETYCRIILLQRRYAVTTAPDSKIDTNTFRPQINGISYDITPALKFRECALDILVKYTNLLSALACRDYLKKTDDAISDLSSSTANFSKSSLKLSAADSKTVGSITGTLANAISTVIIDRKRIHALKSVMDSSQTGIQKLTDLLQKSNDKILESVKFMRMALIGHANIIRPAYGTLNRYAFDLEFANLLDEITDIEMCLILSDNTLRKLPACHAEIRKLLDKKDCKLDALKDLIAEGQKLGDVYNNLNK
jgi:hypothetical protein